ncbi:MAG: substrate-binding domain-containing protein [Spirochaetota bacterium]
MKKNGDTKIKYQFIYQELLHNINAGHFINGQRLPTEVELVKQFKVSRPTVARALRQLQKEGIVERRTKVGSYVRVQKRDSTARKMFGLLIPGLGDTEIFELICGQMAALSKRNNFTLLWGGSMVHTKVSDGLVTEQVCHQYIDQKVDGVFFAPCELMPDAYEVNYRIVRKLEKAKIPLVLIDRDIVTFPERSSYDLVGIDNYRSGYILAHHLLKIKREQVDFLAYPFSAETVEMRILGYQEALRRAGIQPDTDWVHTGDPDDLDFIRTLVDAKKIRAIICANDVTAAVLMHSLDEIGVKVPQGVRVVGHDDIKYAKHLRVPLTTLRQPCQELGIIAVHTMLKRLANPDLPPRNILLNGKLVVRKSCGHALYS